MLKKNPFLSAALKSLTSKILNSFKIGMLLEKEEKTWNPHVSPEVKRILSSIITSSLWLVVNQMPLEYLHLLLKFKPEF